MYDLYKVIHIFTEMPYNFLRVLFMKLLILKSMRLGKLYFREELESFTRRIDFELARLTESGDITKHYQGIYSLSGSQVSNDAIIDKIMSRDRGGPHLIIPANLIKNPDEDLDTGDYICLNHKRSDLIATRNFKIRFRIPSHGFPKSLTDTFLLIYQLNTSLTPERDISDIDFKKFSSDREASGELKKYANKKTYKLITDRIQHNSKISEISQRLSSIGAPLISDKKRGPIRGGTSLEKIIADALAIGMHEPRIHNILPFTILKNSSRIDFTKLGELTKKNGAYRYAGFILELLKRAGFDGIPGFKAPRYSREPAILFKETYGKRGIERLKSSHLDFALGNWGILIDAHIDSERDKIRKWL